MAKRTPDTSDDSESKKPPAISPNPAEKKRSKGENARGNDGEMMEIDNTDDPRQDLAGRFEALVASAAGGESQLTNSVYDCKAEHKNPPTYLYLSQPDPVKEKTKSYRESDVLPSEHSDKAEIHSMTLAGRTEINKRCNNPVGTPITIAQWRKLFETSFKGTEVIDRKMKFFALRLSKTPPDTLPELLGKLRVWRETTTTSPSGRHLGRYKAIFAKGEYDPATEEDQYLEFCTKQQQIASYILSIINACLRNQHVLERWKTIVNVMIFKDPGVFKIHRLRIIHLFEADFNLLLAVKWRKALRVADNLDRVHSGQYGGRPGCEAQFLPLMEELKYDISYMSRRTLYNFDNDAKSCYDRIIPSLASLTNRMYGVHRQVVHVHANTLHEAKYKLKLGNKVSDIEYSHCPNFPLYGTGQGSGNSPFIWLFLSATLFDAHASKAFGATFRSVLDNSVEAMSMAGFVDDTTGTCNDFQPESQQTTSEIGALMAHDAQLWNDLLYSSGGCLELTKTSYQILCFEFQPNGKPRVANHLTESQIFLEDAESHQRFAITELAPDVAHKTLGHYKSPADTRQRKQLQAITKKAQHLSILIGTSPISRGGAALAYQSIYIPAIKYPLPQSFFTQRVLATTEARFAGTIIAKCGYNRHAPSAVIYGPKQFGGAGFIHWYTLQGEGQVVNFLKHWRTDTTVSRLVRITLSWAQWQAGISQSILIDTRTALPHLECRWLKSLRAFLQHAGAAIHVHTPFIPQCEREGDMYIMDYAVRTNYFSPQELCTINYCRLFLHVTTVSELFNAQGTQILPDMFACRRSTWFSASNQNITIQRRPSAYQIKYQWQRLCREWCCDDGRISEAIKFGKWLVSSEKMILRRSTYIVYNRKPMIYHWKNNTYWAYHRGPSNSTRWQPAAATMWVPTRNSVPVDVTNCAEQDLLLNYNAKDTQTTQHNSPSISSFEEYADRLSNWEKSLMQGSQQYYTADDLLNEVRDASSPRILGATDGSLQGKTSTYGWVIGNSTGKVFMDKSGEGSGEPTAHRAESWSILSCLRYLHHLPKFTNRRYPEGTSIEIHNDNRSLIKALQARQNYDRPYPNTTTTPDWDILEQIHETEAHLPNCTVSYHWIRSHQDRLVEFEHLSIEARYNVYADTLAREHFPSCSPILIAPVFPASRCQLQIGSSTCHSNYIQAIRLAVSKPPLLSYITKKQKWDTQTVNNVDWEVFQEAISRRKQDSSVLLSKLLYDQLPTSAAQAKWDKTKTAKCHHCDANETFEHLMQCTHPISEQFRKQLLLDVTQLLTTLEVPGEFREILPAAIDDWFNNREVLQMNETPTSLHGHISQQNTIGWHNIFKGYWARSWRRFVDHRRSLAPNDTATTTITMISKITNIIWTNMLSLWDSYIETLHKHKSTGPSPTKVQELKQRIQEIHELRHHTLAAHRQQYFHSNVHDYLQHATLTQMRNYLLNYGPAIQKSIQEAQSITTSPLYKFPGFTRSQPANIPPRQSNPIGQREEPIHHKHSRWKSTLATTRTFKAFFQTNQH